MQLLTSIPSNSCGHGACHGQGKSTKMQRLPSDRLRKWGAKKSSSCHCNEEQFCFRSSAGSPTPKDCAACLRTPELIPDAVPTRNQMFPTIAVQPL